MIILKQHSNDFSEDEYNLAFSLMTEERQKSVLRKKQETDRKLSVLGEYLARKGISQFLKTDEKSIIIQKDHNGKPIASGLDVHFSISHSKDLAVCAVSENQIGIDCEFIRHIDLRVTKIACTDSDKEYIFAGSDLKEQQIRFFKVWTAKEAYFKFLGTGITNLKSVNYKDIENNCQCEIDNGYIITIYR